MAHPKPAFVETLIEANNVCSLVWSGDSLVDWASGGVTYQLDGSSTQASVCYSYPFDAATTAPGSEYAVIYQQGNVTPAASDGRSAAPTADVFPACIAVSAPKVPASGGGRTLA